jgi:phoH family protein
MKATQSTPSCDVTGIVIKDISSDTRVNYSGEKYTGYVLDKSTLLACPEVIPSFDCGTDEIFKEWSHSAWDDFHHAYLIIPTSVIEELNAISPENEVYYYIARQVLRRLRRLIEKVKFVSDEEKTNKLKTAIYFPQQKNLFTVFPNTRSLSFFGNSGLKDPVGQLLGAVDSAKNHVMIGSLVLLTNDEAIAIRARATGTATASLASKAPTYTGRREVTVPFELYEDFMSSNCGISLETWQQFMPDEPRLFANEFIVMSPKLGQNGYDVLKGKSKEYHNIGRFDCKQQRIVHLFYFRSFTTIKPKNAGQAMYLEAISHPDISVVVVTGSAGTGKTFLSTVYGTILHEARAYLQYFIVPCAIDFQRAHGYLPGNFDEKIEPNIAPFKNALKNYLKLTDEKFKNAVARSNDPKNLDSKREEDPGTGTKKKGDKKSANANLSNDIEKSADKLYRECYKTIAVEAARGLDFADTFVIYDEFQDQGPREADTLLKRLGNNVKAIIAGDIEQVHQEGLNRQNNGISFIKHYITDLPMVAQISLGKVEVVRSDFVKDYISRSGLTKD